MYTSRLFRWSHVAKGKCQCPSFDYNRSSGESNYGVIYSLTLKFLRFTRLYTSWRFFFLDVSARSSCLGDVVQSLRSIRVSLVLVFSLYFTHEIFINSQTMMNEQTCLMDVVDSVNFSLTKHKLVSFFFVRLSLKIFDKVFEFFFVRKKNKKTWRHGGRERNKSFNSNFYFY